MFLTCKQVSNHLSKEDYAKLPRIRKMTLVFHVLICPICGRYNRQVMKFQDLARVFRKRQEQLLEEETPASPHLDPDAREKMNRALREASEQSAVPRESGK